MSSPNIEILGPNRSFETPTGVAVVAEHKSDRELEAMLKRLDPGLFLTVEVHAATRKPIYTVYHWVGPNDPPVHVLYWTEDRTRQGNPLPPSTGIVYEVESRKRNFERNLVAEADADNVAAVQENIEQADAERETEVTPYFRRRLTYGGHANQRFVTMGHRPTGLSTEKEPKKP